MIYLGIDPGASGGISVFLPETIYAVKMPDTEKGLWEVISLIGPDYYAQEPRYALIEKVGGYVATDYDRPAMGSSQFSFGKNFGACLMALVAAEIPFDLISPRKWQKLFLPDGRMKEESRTAWKKRLKEVAQGLFPNIKVTLAISDALLICEYARRLHQPKIEVQGSTPSPLEF